MNVSLSVYNHFYRTPVASSMCFGSEALYNRNDPEPIRKRKLIFSVQPDCLQKTVDPVFILLRHRNSQGINIKV